MSLGYSNAVVVDDDEVINVCQTENEDLREYSLFALYLYLFEKRDPEAPTREHEII
jgi:hypothetical protein